MIVWVVEVDMKKYCYRFIYGGGLGEVVGFGVGVMGGASSKFE